jgi:hypothetical protein
MKGEARGIAASDGLFFSGPFGVLSDGGESKFSENNMPQCHYVQNGSHMDHPGLQGVAIAQAISRRLPTPAARVRAQVKSCGICGGESDTGAVFVSEYFGFLSQFSLHRLLHTHLSSGAGTIGQLVADVPSGLSVTPP